MWRPWGSEPATFNFINCMERLQEVNVFSLKIYRIFVKCYQIMKLKTSDFLKYFIRDIKVISNFIDRFVIINIFIRIKLKVLKIIIIFN